MAPASLSPYGAVHALVARRTGMALSDLQCRRLDEKLAGRPGGTSAQFVLHLQSPSGAAELAELIDAITVQKTDLFRDEAQLAALRTHVLEPLVDRAHRPLRIWSAGCATGEEVATLLVMLAELGADPGSTVLGTDVSETAIARARELCFTAEQLQRVPPMVRDRWFVPVGLGRFSLVGHLKDRASFQCHNLMDTPYPAAPDGRGFDLIACRNVLIYFTSESFERVVGLLARSLLPEGVLMLSAAEPLLLAPPSLRTLRCEQAFFYVRVPDPPPATEGSPPGAPRTPSYSGLPAVSASPSVPRTPSYGGLPAVGAPPGAPRTPSYSSLPAVGAPPSAPKTPSHSGLPAVGALPGAPRTPSYSGLPAVSAPPSAPKTPSHSGLPAVSAPPGAPKTPSHSGLPVVAPARPEAPAEPQLSGAEAYSKADALFAQVLERASGSEAPPLTAETLWRCLMLDPDMAAARYLLGMLLEQRGALTEAAGEYRLALQSLEQGRARATPFFLNNARLQVACAHAIERVERAAGSTPQR